MTEIIESCQYEAYESSKKRKLYWRLVTHRLDDGTTLTMMYAPGGKDTGLRDDAARQEWTDLTGEPTGQQQMELF